MAASGTAAVSAGTGSPQSRAFTGYALAALVGAGALAGEVTGSLGWAADDVALLGSAALAAGFALARAVAIEVDLRGESLRVTVTEVPLVIGLLLLPGALVIAASAAAAVVMGAIQRTPPLKLSLNLAVSLLSSTLAVLIVARAAAALPAVPDWVVVLAAVALGNAAGTLGVACGLALLPGQRSTSSTLRLAVNAYAIGMLAAIAVVSCFQLYAAVAWGGLLGGLGLVTLAVTYRAYYGLLREQRDLELLTEVSFEVAGVGHSPDTASAPDGASDDDLHRALELVREQLNATRVVLHRRASGSGGVEPAALVAGKPLPRPTSGREAETVLEWYADGGVRRLHAWESDRRGKRLCHARQACQMLVAPLRGADDLLGLIEVHDRRCRLRGFSTADLRLVDTLASHLATAVDNRRLLARLRYDAYFDRLTGLRSRLGFKEAGAEVLRGRADCAVAVVDLDLLSAVSDALGQAWGCQVLRAVADRIRAALPSDLVAARLDGDRFAILLTDVDDDGAARRARELCHALSAPYPVDRLEVECGPSAGIASSRVEPTRDIDVLLQRADVALRAARNGAAPIRAYARDMGEVFVRRFQLATQFRQALERGEIDLAFQPTLALDTGRINGAEALVRWENPNLGAVDPQELVAVVEAGGLIDLLTAFVLDRALERAASWRAGGHDLCVAVNLSARNLADTAFADRVATALRRHSVPARLLGFELTESAVMADPERALPVLDALHALGVRIALDDFGTGYSSLAYLRRLPVDEVKIDKSFVQAMDNELCDRAVVRAIVELGHSLGLKVTAEGVEQETTRDALHEMGCDTAQGFLIARPLAGPRVAGWLARRARPADRSGMRPALDGMR